MDDRETIPEDVDRFILLGIPSVPYLEAMLLMREYAQQDWDQKQLSQRLYLSEKVALTLLGELEAAGVIARSGVDGTRFCYQPQGGTLATMIDRLAEIYPRKLIAVTNRIHAKTSRRATQFADAFVLRKEGKP